MTHLRPNDCEGADKVLREYESTEVGELFVRRPLKIVSLSVFPSAHWAETVFRAQVASFLGSSEPNTDRPSSSRHAQSTFFVQLYVSSRKPVVLLAHINPIRLAGKEYRVRFHELDCRNSAKSILLAVLQYKRYLIFRQQ